MMLPDCRWSRALLFFLSIAGDCLPGQHLLALSHLDELVPVNVMIRSRGVEHCDRIVKSLCLIGYLSRNKMANSLLLHERRPREQAWLGCSE
jgi:hypothetical protein